MEPNKRTQEFLKYHFSDSEIVTMARESARVQSEKQDLENRLAELRKKFAGDIAAKDTVIERLTNAINNGYEYREIDCGIFYDQPEPGSAQIMRFDTGEIIKTRRMDQNETQKSLFAMPPPEPAPDAEPDPDSSDTSDEPEKDDIDPGCVITGPGGEKLFEGSTSELKKAAKAARKREKQ